MKNTYQANSQQSIFDVALQHYGDIEGVAWLLKDNPTILNEDGLFDLSAPLRIGKAKIDVYVLDSYAGYIPVTEGLDDGYESVLIDEHGDYLIDDNGETPIAF